VVLSTVVRKLSNVDLVEVHRKVHEELGDLSLSQSPKITDFQTVANLLPADQAEAFFALESFAELVLYRIFEFLYVF